MSVTRAATLALFSRAFSPRARNFVLIARSDRAAIMSRKRKTNRPRSDGERDVSVSRLIKNKNKKMNHRRWLLVSVCRVLVVIGEGGQEVSFDETNRRKFRAVLQIKLAATLGNS